MAPASAQVARGAGRRTRRLDRLAIGTDRRRDRLGIWAGERCFEVDDIAKKDFSLVELVAPDDDGLEGQRALAQARDHGFAAGLDAFGNGDLPLAGEQLHRTHFPQIHAHGIVGALGRLLGLGLDRNLLLHFDQLAALAFRFLLGLLALLLLVARLFGLDDVDPHFAEHREHVLDLLGIDLFRGQYRVDLVMGDVTTLLGGANELLDGRVRPVKHRAVRRRGLATLLLRHLFLLRRHLGLGYHTLHSRR